MPPDHSTKVLGADAERFARQWLEQHGLTFVENNYSCRYGELDLIMQEDDEIVFVEVRLRQHESFGSATDSVQPAKQQKLIRTATHYLQARNLEDRSARIDVLGLHAIRADAVEWIRDAIEAS
ncbi:MAG: YraN family protein [Gammaproteobacteria bacterium]|nr:YraN family protein [Gammaproteobacteria bacterium]